MKKISDLHDIVPRTPLLLFIPYDHEDPQVLHIARRWGKDSRDVSENITNCNRVLDFARVYSNDKIALGYHFKLCTRCGKPEDFDAAMKEYRIADAEHRRRYREEEAQREAENQRQWDAYIRELERLQDLMDEIHPTVLDRKNGRLVIKTSEYEEEWLQVVQYEKGRD